VAAQAGTGIEGLEAEGLGPGRVDDLVNIDSHSHAQLLQFVDEGDVDAAVDVFKQFGHLGNSGAADMHHTVENCRIHGLGQLRGCRSATAHDLRNVVASYRIVAWVLSFRREGDVDARFAQRARNLQAMWIAGLQQRDYNFVRCSGIGGAFKHDQLAFTNMRSDGLDRVCDIAQVWFAMLIERGGHADDDRVHLRDFRVICRGAKSGLLRFLNGVGENANDVGTAGVEGFHLVRRNVEAGYPEALATEEQRQRQPNVSHPDDPDAGFAGLHLPLKLSQPRPSRKCHVPDSTA
jgi:hypothetical protein